MSCPVAQNSPDNPNTWQNAKTLIDEVGDDDADPINDEYETSTAGGNNASGTTGIQVPGPAQTSPPGAIDQTPNAEDTAPASNAQPKPTNCKAFNESNIDYNFQLSANFKLSELTNSCVFPHNLVAQHGLTISEIVCNLQALCENVLEEIIKQYPGARVNSAFRQGDGKSQHERGQAADIQWPGISYEEYWNRGIWIKNNLAFDQFIFEHGKSVWLHVSFNRSGTLRRNVLTMYQNKYSPGMLKMR